MVSYMTVLACITGVVFQANGISLDDGEKAGECYTIKSAIFDSVTAAGITFFADHPLSNREFDPNSIDPFTPSVLFEKYYGNEASAVELTKAILKIVHAAENAPKKLSDRDDMRRNLYTYINAGSHDYARGKVGELLRNIIDEYVSEDSEWISRGCIPEEKMYDILEALEIEYYRILNEVGRIKFGQLMSFGVGSTLAFCIDDTGSMSGEISGAKRRAKEIVDYYRGTLDAPQDFVLVPFNDPGVGPVTVTNEAEKYHAALEALYAHGGGDGPELAIRGIQLAIENSRPGSTIYVITDNQGKDFKLQDTVIAQAKQKYITVTFLLTQDVGECSDWGTYKKCMALYKHIARETGGKVLVIGRSDFFRTTDIVQSNTKQGIVTLTKTVLQRSRTKPHHLLHFHVDSKIQELLIQAQGTCKNVYLSLPGKTAHFRVKSQRYGDVWTSQISTKTLNESWTGVWKMGVDTESGDCKVTVQAKTAMGFVFTLFSKPSDVSDDGFQVLRGDPYVDSPVGIVLDGYGLDEESTRNDSVKIKCVSKYGKVLHSVEKPMGQEIKHVFDNGVTQFEPFYIVVEGRDKFGHAYQRMHSVLITPSHVNIECDLSDLIVVPGSTVNANITITNNGPKDRFLVSTSDEQGVSTFHDGSSVSWDIGSKRKVIKRLALQVGASLRDGKAIEITITARGESVGSFQYTKCTLVVGQKRRPRIDAFAVNTVINARFAETVISSTVTNNAPIGREAEFDVLLPNAAFITGIRIEMNNETIHGVIEEKKKAEKIYERAKQRGTVAGHVAARDKSTRSYRTSMFVEAGQKVRFVLTYQEFLARTRGRYQYSVILKPDQPVKSLTVDVHIVEESQLKYVKVLPLKTTSANVIDEVTSGATTSISHHDREAHVRYHPDQAAQTRWSPKGLSATFSIEYEVQRPDMYGEIALNNGYFAHFFAPPNLPPMPKIVVFAVDTSGSMYGYKLRQVTDTLSSILRSLQPTDKFSVIFFGDEVSSPWNHTVKDANMENIDEALTFIDEIRAVGGTNMESALDYMFQTLQPYLQRLSTSESSGHQSGDWSGDEYSGMEPIDNARTSSSLLLDDSAELETELDFEYVKMAVLMTDGSPSIGETDTKVLIKDIKSKNQDRFDLHTIGLGSLVDFSFLEKLAHDNGGTSRRIFDGIDAGVQIRNFFDEIANPILTDIEFNYPVERIEIMTDTVFPVYLGGSEIVVTGRVKPLGKKEGPKILVADEFDIIPGKRSDVPPPNFLISAQVKGKRLNDEIEIMDFDLDPSKQSKISLSDRKISNYTEKLWAFLTLKKLLLDASIEDDKSIKEELNSRALEMSLKYNLVTPLTSLVVVRPDERRAIEAELRNGKAPTTTTTRVVTTTTTSPYVERELALLPSPYALYEDARFSVVDDEDTESDYADYEDTFHGSPMRLAYKPISRTGSHKYVHESRPSYSRPRSGAGGGGFSSDPHFVIPVRPGVKLCFNWDGMNGEIYNFIYDPVRRITVNGMLVNSPAPPGAGRKRRTYVSQMGIVSSGFNKRIMITPWNITIEEPGSPYLVILATSRFTLDKKGYYKIKITPKSPSTSLVELDLEGILFNITLHRRNRSQYTRAHLDLSMVNDLRSLSPDSDGVFGQFSDILSDGWVPPLSDGAMGDDGEIRNEIRIRGKVVKVVNREMPMPGNHEGTRCWYMHKNGVEAMKRPKASFRASNIFDIPLY